MPLPYIFTNPKERRHFLIGTTNMGQTNLQTSLHLNTVQRHVFHKNTSWQLLALYPATYKPVQNKIDTKQQDWTKKLQKKYPDSIIHTINDQISFSNEKTQTIQARKPNRRKTCDQIRNPTRESAKQISKKAAQTRKRVTRKNLNSQNEGDVLIKEKLANRNQKPATSRPKTSESRPKTSGRTTRKTPNLVSA